MGFNKKVCSFVIVIFALVTILLVSGITITWSKGWLVAIFCGYSIFFGAFTWKIEKWLFSITKKVWHKIPQFSDAAQVALIVGLVTPLITILLRILR